MRVVCLIALMIAGCSTSPAPKQSVRFVERVKIQPVLVPILVRLDRDIEKSCTIVVKSIDVCAVKATCYRTGMTCAEAYYRLHVCNETARDGGTRQRKNGVPCQNVCGPTVAAMNIRRKRTPFVVPTEETKICK
jgi:hypothetical protein